MSKSSKRKMVAQQVRKMTRGHSFFYPSDYVKYKAFTDASFIYDPASMPLPR